MPKHYKDMMDELINKIDDKEYSLQSKKRW